MLKILGMLMLGVVVFLAALVGPMAATGNLNPETIMRLLGREEAPEPVWNPDDDLGPLALKISAEQDRLREWEERLSEEDTRLTQRERDLDATLDEITGIQTEISSAIDQLDSEQQASILAIAKTLESMAAANAAIDLEGMSPEDAARILPLIKDRSRGKILDAMKQLNRSLILQVMQERKY